MNLTGRFLKRYLATGQEMRHSQLAELSPPRDSIIFLGDQLASFGNWNEWFPQPRAVRNFGIEGYTVAKMCELVPLIGAPRGVVIMAGGSDLDGLGRTMKPVLVAEQISHLVNRIRTLVDPSRIVVVGLPPSSSRGSHRRKALNSELHRLLPSEITFVDVWSALSGNDDRLRPEYRSLRWSGPLYRKIVQILRQDVAWLREAQR